MYPWISLYYYKYSRIGPWTYRVEEYPLVPTANPVLQALTTEDTLSHTQQVQTYVRTYARTLKLVHAPVGMATSWWITERALAILVRAPNKLGWTHLWGWGWGWGVEKPMPWISILYICMWGKQSESFRCAYVCTYMHGVRTCIRWWHA